MKNALLLNNYIITERAVEQVWRKRPGKAMLQTSGGPSKVLVKERVLLLPLCQLCRRGFI